MTARCRNCRKRPGKQTTIGTKKVETNGRMMDESTATAATNNTDGIEGQHSQTTKQTEQTYKTVKHRHRQNRLTVEQQEEDKMTPMEADTQIDTDGR